MILTMVICIPSIANMEDRKSTRLNSSHDQISYAVFCLKKKKRLLQDAGEFPRLTVEHVGDICLFHEEPRYRSLTHVEARQKSCVFNVLEVLEFRHGRPG